jgi:hypothetical protein
MESSGQYNDDASDSSREDIFTFNLICKEVL